jgi:hypothetical protein
MSSPKVNNATIIDLEDSEADEILNKVLKRTKLRMIIEIKEDIYKYLNKFKEETNS